jgi:hypothetical protein
MGNIQMIGNEKNLGNQFFLVFFLKLLNDQKNFGHQINVRINLAIDWMIKN